jgi:hypothetical protein
MKKWSMKLPRVSGEHLYAVAIQEDADLWLGLWVKCSPNGFFILRPMPNRKENIHTSYHRNGQLHMKTDDHKTIVQQRQPLTDSFHGTESLFGESGFRLKAVGAICEPAKFREVIIVPTGVLEMGGAITVDLVAPGSPPTDLSFAYEVVDRQTFTHTTPNVVITILRPSIE